MSEKFVLLATYHMPVEAQLARGRLEADGIKAVLTGGGSVDVFGGIQGVAGQIQLQVPESDALRAAAILSAIEADREERDEDRAADEAALWLCPLCGDAVGYDLEVCPECETPRPDPQKSPAITAVPMHNSASQDVQEKPARKTEKITSETPREAAPSVLEDDLEAPDLETLVGDDLVRRAFLTALFPVLIPYSFWLLGRLAFYSGKISPRMMPRLYWAIVLDSVWLFLLLFGGLRVIAFLVMRRPL